MFEWIEEVMEAIKKDAQTIADKYKKQEEDGTTLTDEHEKQAKSEVAAAIANHVATLSDKGAADGSNPAAGTQANADTGATDDPAV